MMEDQALRKSPASREKGKSTLVSRNITVLGRRTSIRLEPEMWRALGEIALRERCSVHEICTLINVRKHQNTSLTAAIRVFIMLYFRSASTEDGHGKVGHGNFEIMKARARIPAEYSAFFKRNKKNDNRYGGRDAEDESWSGSFQGKTFHAAVI